MSGQTGPLLPSDGQCQRQNPGWEIHSLLSNYEHVMCEHIFLWRGPFVLPRFALSTTQATQPAGFHSTLLKKKKFGTHSCLRTNSRAWGNPEVP